MVNCDIFWAKENFPLYFPQIGGEGWDFTSFSYEPYVFSYFKRYLISPKRFRNYETVFKIQAYYHIIYFDKFKVFSEPKFVIFTAFERLEIQILLQNANISKC